VQKPCACLGIVRAGLCCVGGRGARGVRAPRRRAEGPYSALAANGNLCKAKSLAMPTEFVGQNGALIKTTTKIAVSGCAKAKQAKQKRRR